MSATPLPTTPGMARCVWGLSAFTPESPMPRGLPGKTEQSVRWRWRAEYELPPMKRADAEAWVAFLCALNGQAGRFTAYDWARRTNSGSLAGTPTVFSAAIGGTTLQTRGWTPAAPAILAAGDYVAWATDSGGRELHMVVEAAYSTGTYLYGANGYGQGNYGYGDATLTITPAVREVPDKGDALIVSGAYCIMQLAQDDGAAWDVDAASVYGLRFAAIEAICVLPQVRLLGAGATAPTTATVAGVKL